MARRTTARRVRPETLATSPATLTLSVHAAEELTADERAETLALCSLAFEMDYEPLYRTFDGPIHVLARLGGELVSHALWVTRWLEVGPSDRQPDGLGLLRTAYVEAVATHPDHRHSGYATAVMQRLEREISGYDLGALSPGAPELYSALGWERWLGPLSVRVEGELQPTLDEEVMILRLPGTPSLALDAPLSCEWREGEVW